MSPIVPWKKKTFRSSTEPTNRRLPVECRLINIKMGLHLSCLSNLFGLKAFNF